MKINKLKKIFICISFIVLFILASLIEINAEVIDYSSSSSSTTDYTYSEIINWLTGTNPSNNEIAYYEYLNDDSVALKIDKQIPKSKVTYDFDGTNLTVHAYSYSYVDNDENTHIYLPTKATLSSEVKSLILNDPYYECEFINVDSDLSNVEIEYNCKFVLSKDDCNALLNKAYEDAKYFIDNNVEENNNQLYQQNLALYNQYLIDLNAYNLNKQDYQNYLIVLEDYNDKKTAYDNYLIALENYNNQVTAYNNYLIAQNQYAIDLGLYEQYLQDLENYNIALASYNEQYPAYSAKMEKINHQLLVMEVIQLGMEFGSGDDLELRSVKDAILGDAVTNVLSQKEDLSILEADQDAIDRAEIATINLREIFNQYFEKETDQEKYNFYSYREGVSFTNYKKLKTNMEELLRCLDKLYRSGRVEEALIFKGKKEKYLFLVAQLAFVCNALSDEDVYNYEGWVSGKGTLSRPGACIYDNTWTIDGRTINQILGSNVTAIEDNTVQAYPLTGGYPSELVEPTAPTEVVAPTMPDVVSEPGVAPTSVLNPGVAPNEVIELSEPTVVNEPTPYVVPTELRNICDDYENSLLVQRTLLNSDYELDITTTVIRNFKSSDLITIEFHDEADNLLSTETTEKSSYIVYNDKPIKNPDEINEKYEFIGWTYSDGEILNLLNVERSGFVYPQYLPTKREYTITWEIGSIKQEEKYYYGDTPSYKGEIKKSPLNNISYEFVKWDKDCETVTSDVTYKAVFKENIIIDKVTNFVLNENSLSIKINEIKDINVGSLLINYPELKSIVIETYGYSITLDKNSIKELINNNIDSLSFEMKEIKSNEYSYDLVIKNSNNETIHNENITCEAKIIGSFDSVHNNVYYQNDGKDILIHSTIQNKSLNFTMNSKYNYVSYNSYTLNITKNDFVGFSVDTTKAKQGSVVRINIDTIENGKKIDQVYIVNSKGEKVIISNYEFVMFNSDIYIGVNVSDIIYTINFIDKDFIIDSKQYKYGEEIVVPKNPTRLSDEENSYNFIGWSINGEVVEVPNIVTSDLDLVAKFESVPSTLGPLEQRSGKIIPTIIISCFVIVSGIVLTIILVKRKKRKINKI